MKKSTYEWAIFLSYSILFGIPSLFDRSNMTLWYVSRIGCWGAAMAVFLFSSFFAKKKLFRWWESLSSRTCVTITVILAVVFVVGCLVDLFVITTN